MHWSDEGIVLSARKHGEHALIVHLLTREHGRHAGLVRGGTGRRARGVYEPGNRVTAEWRARLADHLGTYRCELARSGAAGLLEDPLRLAALSSACAVAESALPERERHIAVYEAFLALLDALAAPEDAGETPGRWAEAYVRWELGLLAELGFGLDLSRCAATGRNDNLAWVSPRSGRAVSLSAGEPWRDRLLALPAFLLQRTAPAKGDIAAGLSLTGFFLDRHIFAAHNRAMPRARSRFAERAAGL